MSLRTRLTPLGLPALVAFGLALFLPASATLAAGPVPGPADHAPQLTCGEVPSAFYDSILYSEVGPTLREIESHSNRLRVEVIGQSAGGRNLYLVTLSAPEVLARLGDYQAARRAMLQEPASGPSVAQVGDVPVPILINAGTHGDEYPGVDAAIRLIERLAFDDGAETQQVLANEILLIHVVQNPDGRVLGWHENAAGFDLDRDFLTQSQPEVQAMARVLAEWSPLAVIDLHGFMSPTHVAPCIAAPGPAGSWEAYSRWTVAQAQAMQAALLAQTGLDAQISFSGAPEAQGAWPPVSLATFAMYHGAYGQTLEAGYEDERGVDALYAATWGALRFVAQNRAAMLRDQLDLLARGFPSAPEAAAPAEGRGTGDGAAASPPAAYIIPAEVPLQESPHEAARLVDLLLRNGVEVERSREPVAVGGAIYPPGSYLVRMDQPKRSLASGLLWAWAGDEGGDSSSAHLAAGWSLPLLWGVTEVAVREPLALQAEPVGRAGPVVGQVGEGPAAAYAYLPTSNEAIRATNDLLGRGVEVYRALAPLRDGGRELAAGAFIVPGGSEEARAVASELAGEYGLILYALPAMPADARPLRRARLAVSASEGVMWALRSLGFDVVPISARQINAGLDLSGYDLLVVSGGGDFWGALGPQGAEALRAFFAAGRGLVGIGRSGAMVNQGAALLDLDFATGDYYDVGILRLQADPADPITAGYPAGSYGFASYPLWFTRTGSGVVTSARIAEGDFFVSGSWADWRESGAAGKAIVVHGRAGATPVALMGIEPASRGHPALTFRLLANAIYSALVPAPTHPGSPWGNDQQGWTGYTG